MRSPSPKETASSRRRTSTPATRSPTSRWRRPRAPGGGRPRRRARDALTGRPAKPNWQGRRPARVDQPHPHPQRAGQSRRRGRRGSCREAASSTCWTPASRSGSSPVDVGEIGCDMLSATGRKFLRGPRGTGFLYVRRAVARPAGAAVPRPAGRRVDGARPYELRGDARRFETWERYVAGQIGLGVAADYALDLGPARIEERVPAGARLRDRARGAAGLDRPRPGRATVRHRHLHRGRPRPRRDQPRGWPRRASTSASSESTSRLDEPRAASPAWSGPRCTTTTPKRSWTGCCPRCRDRDARLRRARPGAGMDSGGAAGRAPPRSPRTPGPRIPGPRTSGPRIRRSGGRR